mmetsp:Transcript_8638/g.11275  ORF Transcript_8638/g.11275 Transcript_8638/m.11275 type:complete len:309 (+) Transcript_8638:14-940(+)
MSELFEQACEPPNKRVKSGASDDSAPKESDKNEAELDTPDDEVSYVVITNDGTRENMIRLVTLKNIFAKQLPKMPKEYIVRLVMDRRHYSIALMKQGFAIGGICFRPYHDQKFAEIAFCAVTGSEQVKGYGTSLMNELKQHVKRMNITHFLTYADNYAIGYFEKQGFSKVLLLPRERWYGYIKDYDGGTLMECYVHPTVNFPKIKEVIKIHREFLLNRIQSASKEHIVYPGLDCFEKQLSSSSSSSSSSNVHTSKKIELKDIPGLVEGGWEGYNDFGEGRLADDKWRQFVGSLAVILKEVQKHSSSWP